ncbi:lipocalin family protein [Hymenobacter lucidus]|uniref:Lipocalin family protein n=1 Tax=Hymenobacter lucidus TaxID=2880930 RepID=A0ABS8AV84_9BACT|nr:lipocalin family protein [Hymenobacter lucidus]MCB2409306.1 lipocalin family protein [Hymenobacter lucidus]
MQRSSLIVLSLLLVGSLGSCKKDEVESKAGTLTGKKWQVTAATVTYTGSQTGTEDAYKTLEACEKDNYIVFNSNKSLEVNEGKNVCADSEQMAMGTWDINSDQTKIYINSPELGGSAAVQMDIAELSSSKLVLKNTIVQPDLTAVTTTTFTAQ